MFWSRRPKFQPGVTTRDMSVKPGLYKVEFRTADGFRRGVVYAADGRLLGGNQAFGFVGAYTLVGDAIAVDLTTTRHNTNLAYKPLFGADVVKLMLVGRARAHEIAFTNDPERMPDVKCQFFMWPISLAEAEEGAAPVTTGIPNGLYSMHIQMLDGIGGGNTGVVLLHSGLMHGGDAWFDYIGSYTAGNGRWKGELVNHEHSPPEGERHIFGGYEVGIGFSGVYADGGAEAEATALAGKRSLRFKAVLKLIAEV